VFQIYLKRAGIYVVIVVFLSEAIGLSYAAVTMDELGALFTKKTGKKWEQVTHEERQDFLYEIRGKERVQERKERVEGVKIPYYIRESFKNKKGMKWENATEKEQTDYVKKYKKLERNWERDEKDRIKATNKEKKNRAKILKNERKKIAKRKKMKQKEKKRIQREEKDRKKREKKQIKDFKKKIRDMQKRSKQQRKR